MAAYVSDATLFLNDLKAKNPAIEADQQYGRSLLWEKAPRSLDQMRREQDARVPQKPYAYQTNA